MLTRDTRTVLCFEISSAKWSVDQLRSASTSPRQMSLAPSCPSRGPSLQRRCELWICPPLTDLRWQNRSPETPKSSSPQATFLTSVEHAKIEIPRFLTTWVPSNFSSFRCELKRTARTKHSTAVSACNSSSTRSCSSHICHLAPGGTHSACSPPRDGIHRSNHSVDRLFQFVLQTYIPNILSFSLASNLPALTKRSFSMGIDQMWLSVELQSCVSTSVLSFSSSLRIKSSSLAARSLESWRRPLLLCRRILKHHRWAKK